MRELFIVGREPASACPRGAPEQGEPGLLAKLIAWSEAHFKRTRSWVASRLGDERPVRERTARERYLGARKLPDRAHVPAPSLSTDGDASPGEEVVIPDAPPTDTEPLEVTQPEPAATALPPGDAGSEPPPAERN